MNATPIHAKLNERAEKRMGVGYSRLLFTNAFFAAILYKHRRTIDVMCDTLWIDGKNIGYNPTYILTLDSDELQFAIAHEALHVAGMHHLRRGDRDNDLWNVACDHVVNALLEDGKIGKKPKGWLDGIPGMTPEAIYDRLKQKQREEQQQERAERPQDDDGQQGDSQGSNAPDASQGNGQGDQDDDANGQSSQGDQQGDASSKPSSFGEVRDQVNDDGTRMTPAERDLAEAETRVMIDQATRIATRAGQMPGNVKHFVDKVTERRVAWQEILARFIDSRARNDFNWSRPNLRYMSAGAILPSLSTPAYGAIVYAFDTSHSNMWAINQGCEELRSCLATYAVQGEVPDVWALWCDTVVHAQLLNDEADELKPGGHGGTDFAPVFEYVDREGLDPRAIVYLTDGECSSFGKEPDCPVLWLLTQPCDSFKPPFGEVALMPERAA